MNGSVVPMLEKPKHDAIAKKVKALNEVFYVGDKLSAFEDDIERMYMSEKMDKHHNY